MKNNFIRLLIIEDEEFDIRRIENTVRPYDKIKICDIVSNGYDAIDLVTSKKDFYDVVIMDYQIAGGLMGEELIKEIKKLSKTTQIIVVTKMTIQQTDYNFANRLLEAGAFWFCTKYPGDIETYIYQPTDFVLSIVNAFDKRKLEIERNNSHFKLNKGVQDILSKKVIIGKSPSIQKLKKQIQQFANTNANILIIGQSGTGKELVAANIHYLSKRNLENFVPINCSCIPRELMESELFGFEKGSFTGARESRQGLFERANGGTIFLDEISEFPLSAQSKLLRVLEDGQIDKIGRKKSYKVDVRVIAATNKELEIMMLQKKFREDLYYRLNVLQIYIPPLHERPEDIPILAEHYLRLYSFGMGRTEPEFDNGAMEILINYSWPGNVRQLQNVIQRMLFMSGSKITESEVFDAVGSVSHSASKEDFNQNFNKENILPLRQIERTFRRSYFKFVRRNSNTDADAAHKLGLAPPNYHRICKELDLK